MLINLFGGPCSGKSTTALGLTYFMKKAGMRVELVPEFAKKLVMDGRSPKCQEYIFGKQVYYIEKALAVFDHVVTDSPVLLSTVYGETTDTFKNLARQTHERLNPHLNLFVLRTKPYDPVGRYQTEEEAHELDCEIRNELKWYPFLETNDDAQELFERLKAIL